MNRLRLSRTAVARRREVVSLLTSFDIGTWGLREEALVYYADIFQYFYLFIHTHKYIYISFIKYNLSVYLPID